MPRPTALFLLFHLARNKSSPAITSQNNIAQQSVQVKNMAGRFVKLISRLVSSHMYQHTHTLMEMRTDLTAVPHASLRNRNPERSRKALTSLGVFKRKCGPKRKAKPIRQSDGVPCVTAAALALYKNVQTFEDSRYVTVISRDIRMYCGRFVGPSLTAHGWSPC